MSTPVPPSLVVAFAIAGGRNAIPVAAPPGPGAASYTLGFPPATRTLKSAGGIPPAGLDMNGVLFDATANIAWLAAGGSYAFNADVVTNSTGYHIGAIVRSAADPTQYFYNLVANNANNPDSVITGWVQFSPLASATGVQAANVAAGSQTVALSTTTLTGFLDLTPNAGDTTVTNITGGKDGQIITVTNMHASNLLTLQANSNIRMVGDLTLNQFGVLTLRRSASLSKWVPMS